MLIAYPAEEDSQTEINLSSIELSQLSAEVNILTAHFCMDHIPDARAKKIHQLFLNDGKLSQKPVLVASKDGVGQAAKTEGSRETLKFSIGENVGRGYGRDFGWEALL